ncbi:MAG: DUF3298 and DUF4163 domain-containing protein [Bacteroidia bacterium]|nr:DUF3298 and DUF4163 domain-containing protein [Bacteroidia bacterium]
MNKFLLFLAVLLFVIGCRDEQSLGMLPMTYTQQDPKVQLQLPQADSTLQLGRSVNEALEEEVISLLAFDEALDISDITMAVKSFTAGYKELTENFPGTPEWEANVTANISYEDAHILSIKMESYLFTGGAHGYEEIRFLNFDKRRGRVIEGINMFTNFGPILDLAEAAFRHMHNIPEEASINSTGFMFEGEVFHLPDTIGFDTHGMILHYNQYEVASYADGPIRISLPWVDVQPLLRKKYRP